MDYQIEERGDIGSTAKEMHVRSQKLYQEALEVLKGAEDAQTIEAATKKVEAAKALGETLIKWERQKEAENDAESRELLIKADELGQKIAAGRSETGASEAQWESKNLSNPLLKSYKESFKIDDEDRPSFDFTGQQKMAFNARGLSASYSGISGKNLQMAQKALGEGTGAGGGYLVVPSYLQDMFAETRRQGNALRMAGKLNVHPTDTNLLYIPQGAGAASVGWVGENASKPSADQSYAQLAVNVFTLAGISKVSLQLVQDSNPTAVDLVSRELGSLIGNAEEQAIWNGSGSGQPQGIIGLGSSLASNATNSTAATAQALIVDIINIAAKVQTAYFAPIDTVAMTPTRMAYLQTGQDTATNFLFNAPGTFRAPGGLGGLGALDYHQIFPWLGVDLVTTTNIPFQSSTHEYVIAGNFQEAHWFQRQELTMEASDQAGTSFESNQVWYRLEERCGFTAARYPKAFATVAGASGAYG